MFRDASGITGGGVAGWSWDFGDGNSTISIEKNPKYRFLSPGVYNVCLIVKATNGSEDKKCKMVPVYSVPEANFTYSSVGCIGDTIRFVDMSTISHSNIIQRTWKFGDGSGSNVQNPYKIYRNAGSYDN
jgi:PKD repeat protein